MAESSGASPGSGSGSSWGGMVNDLVRNRVSQINESFERFEKSSEIWMDNTMDIYKADLAMARSVRDDKDRFIDYLAQFCKTASNGGGAGEEEMDIPAKVQLLTEIKDTIGKIDVRFTNRGNKYKEATMAEIEKCKQEMERIESVLADSIARLSEVAQQLTAKRRKRNR